MRLIVTGGGTGGHIYPALAFVKYLMSVEPDSQILYVGTEKGLESKIVPATGLDFKTIDIQGFRRSLSLENVKTVYKFLTSRREAKKIIKDFQPDLVIGTGGYVAGPMVSEAARMKVPTIIHEQNSIPGITNKYLAKSVDRIALAFKEANKFFPAGKTVMVGNPRAQEVADLDAPDALKKLGLSPHKETVVIFGGSRGALKINQAMIEALPALARKPYQVVYASGEAYWNDYQDEFAQYADLDNIVIKPYIANMNEILSNASLVVSRAGATTLAELTSLGIPAVLIPSPYVTADHQTKNAQALEDAGAAQMIKDAELTGSSLVEAVDHVLLNPDVYQAMSSASLKEGMPDASRRLYNLAKEVINER
jgi:UDP-N-acetylglucosamine--N-acetylmuramyl-(pentapeptide) pyrophosphoryl-undecaprenol N-acetylglucosamine transferase